MLVGKADLDPFDQQPTSSRRITQMTRRDIFDHIRSEGVLWWGRLDEVRFLSRLYDLEKLPSTDSRFKTAHGDIVQHRFNNLDWDDDWVFDDPRFELANGPDDKLLGFLAQMVHPVVAPDNGQATGLVQRFNDLLDPDGWTLKPVKQLSGRPVYTAARTNSGGVAVALARDAATRVDSEYISQLVIRMEGAIDADPGLAIGTAKEFVESICKTILDDLGEPYSATERFAPMVRKTAKLLRLGPDDIDDAARAADTIKKMLMNLAQLVDGSAELRNHYGAGHGKSKTQARSGLGPRHARLAVGAAATLGCFLYETHETRQHNGGKQQ